MYLSLYCKGSKRLFKVLWWEGVGDRTELQYIDQTHTISVVSFSFSRAAQPEAEGLTLLAFSTASYHQLVWSPNSIGVPEGPFCRVWLSLPHLVSNFSGPQLFWLPTQSGAPMAPSAWCGFPYHISSLTVWLLVLTELYNSSHPLNHPLNLWNDMFDRHQAEITVMQFRGHSLPVYQSMSVPWDFLPCPISSAKHAYAISSHNCHWNVSLPSGASLWNGKFGRVEGQNTTIIR